MPNSFHSLRKKKDFDQVFASGHSFYCPILGIKALKNGLNDNRYGIIISNKVSKQATSRNRLRRQIREILRKEFLESTVKYDLVVIALNKLFGQDFEEIRVALLRGGKALKII